jgi:hypothetical protein
MRKGFVGFTPLFGSLFSKPDPTNLSHTHVKMHLHLYVPEYEQDQLKFLLKEMAGTAADPLTQAQMRNPKNHAFMIGDVVEVDGRAAMVDRVDLFGVGFTDLGDVP